MSKLLEKLNDSQKEAVESLSGPVMVIAGAGSGKTRVLTHRLAYLVECGVDSENILAVTFTNKAASEMKERISSLIDTEVLSWVMTFHSMCARILRRHANILGYNRSFDILDDDDSLKVLKEVMKGLNLNTKDYNPKMYRNLISAKKNGKDIKMDIVEEQLFENVYFNYNESLKRENLMDFDDLLVLTVKLFEENIDILEYYQEKFRYIMIDEFQDTNNIQFRLVLLLGSKYKNVFIVGDEDQSIYSFRGANIGNIRSFIKHFNPKKIVLDINYRSTQNILNVANSLIDKNQSRIKKDLKSINNNGSLIVYKNLESAYEEEMFIVRTIDELRRQGYKYSDIAILYRNNSLSRSIEETFLKLRVPYKIFGGISFFGRKEIKDMLAYLKLMIDVDNVWAFKRVINVPKRGVGNATVEKIMDCVNNGMSLSKAIISTNIPKVVEFRNMIVRLSQMLEKMPITSYVDTLLSETGYKKMLEEEDDEERLDNIKELKSVLAESEENYEGMPFEKLRETMDYLSLRTDKDDVVKGDDCVNMMTYHQAKGLEFKVVFMMALEDGIFPRNLFDNSDIEEERRVAYVGITRAKEVLYLSSAKSRRLYGQLTFAKPSMFIREIDSKLFKGYKPQKPAFNSKIIFDQMEKNDITYKAGDKINHQAFGDGVVVSVDGDFITVAFGVAYGIKKLLAKHPSIRKL